MNTPNEMIKMALLNMRPHRGRRVRWGVVVDLFGIGSYSAQKLCKKHGVEPYEMIDGPCVECDELLTEPTP